jgi:hypothetical protein
MGLGLLAVAGDFWQAILLGGVIGFIGGGLVPLGAFAQSEVPDEMRGRGKPDGGKPGFGASHLYPSWLPNGQCRAASLLYTGWHGRGRVWASAGGISWCARCPTGTASGH